VETGEPLPKDLFEKMDKARTFHAALFMARQLEFSLFDLALHEQFDEGDPQFVQKTLDAVRKQVAVTPIHPLNRFAQSFSHIFAGGYAAGYYSYKWAEVLSSDAFSRFEEEGLFSKAAGHDFRQIILAAGNSADPMDLFIQFRGRKPTIDALLRHSGIV
jgi:oligopeptidase A